MELVKWRGNGISDPFSSLRQLQDEINELFDLDRFPTSAGLFDRAFSPSIDMIEEKDNFTVVCEAPGMNEDDLDVNISSNVLTIKGKKADSEEEENKGRYYRKEIWSGSFQRTISLPSSVDNQKISAELKNGMLKVILPKREESKPKQITVAVK